jgi:uncharacterized membrane protein
MPRLPVGLAGEDGDLKLVTVAPSPADYVDAALSPMRHNCTDHPAVVTRFVHMVDELAYLAEDSQVNAALLIQLDALTQQLREQKHDPVASEELLALASEVRTRIQRQTDRGAP